LKDFKQLKKQLQSLALSLSKKKVALYYYKDDDEGNAVRKRFQILNVKG